MLKNLPKSGGGLDRFNFFSINLTVIYYCSAGPYILKAKIPSVQVESTRKCVNTTLYYHSSNHHHHPKRKVALYSAGLTPLFCFEHPLAACIL